MVKSSFFFLAFLLICVGNLQAQDVHIDASVNQNVGVADQSIKGTITITHDSKEKVDPSSFQLEGKPLETSLIQSVPMSAGQSSTLVSIYSFELPAKEEGLYVLAPISVKVGTKRYQSIAASYTISPAAKQPKATTVSAPTRSTIPSPSSKEDAIRQQTVEENDAPPVFTLEAFLKGPSPFYPGQRAQFVYRISYNRNIDLATSQLPLLYTQDFRKIGDAHIEDYEQNGLTIQDITQEIEAIKPGSFHYEESSITGYAYKIESNGKKTVIDELLSAKAPEMIVEVAQFPTKNQPASFNGAIATQLDAEVKMLTPDKIHVGDAINLEILVSGPSNLMEMNLPNLACQPGFSGFFILNDLPPLAQSNKNQKKFTVNLRAISSFIKAIPSIEISAFDPTALDYIIWRSPEIPLTVTEIPVADESGIEFSPLQPVQLFLEDMKGIIKKSDVKLPAIKDFEPILVSSHDLKWSWIQTPFVLFMIPIGIGCLFWIWKRLETLSSNPGEQKMSEKFFKDAFNTQTLPSQIPVLLKQAFTWYIKEHQHFSESKALNLTKFNKIQTFLDELDDFQYGYPKERTIENLLVEADKLWRN